MVGWADGWMGGAGRGRAGKAERASPSRGWRRHAAQPRAPLPARRQRRTSAAHLAVFVRHAVAGGDDGARRHNQHLEQAGGTEHGSAWLRSVGGQGGAMRQPIACHLVWLAPSSLRRPPKQQPQRCLGMPPCPTKAGEPALTMRRGLKSAALRTNLSARLLFLPNGWGRAAGVFVRPGRSFGERQHVANKTKARRGPHCAPTALHPAAQPPPS